MDKKEYDRLCEPGIPLNSATRKAMKKFESERRWAWGTILLVNFVILCFAGQFIRYWLHG